VRVPNELLLRFSKSRLRGGWPTRDVGGRASGSAVLKIRLRQFPSSRLGAKMTIAGGVRRPLLNRPFPQEMINPGQALAAMLTADAGG
jgi:hypothetical protein